jgi:hypothetical protein
LAKEFGLSHNVDVAVVVQTKFPWPVVDSDSGLSQCDGGLDDDGDGSVVVGVACRKKKKMSAVFIALVLLLFACCCCCFKK